MNYYFWLLAILILSSSGCKRSLDTPAIWVSGVTTPEISLDGVWKFSMNPPEEFWKMDIAETWDSILVPGECAMQGFAIKHDIPFVYQKEFRIPADYSGKEILLRFEGVYSYARVWVNGQFVRDHSGGFTRWECDITSYAKAGEKTRITVEVTDRADEISYGSGYAKHPIGGILRSVQILALPHNYPKEVFIETDFDTAYKDAVLNVSGSTRREADALISLTLRDMQGTIISLQHPNLGLSDDSMFMMRNLIQAPFSWDAEHPYLYQLEISFTEAGKLTWKKVYHIGFRDVEVESNRLLVNGNQVKLRGACRHDIHPTLGRISAADLEEKDVLLAKEANFNFIRTSHYPPTDHFLQLCDEHGLYVEDETAVCFVGSHRTKEYYPGSSESDSAFTHRYLAQLQEMVDNHRNHPSVIIWSIGNENEFGANFKESYDWVKANDPSRPVIFSYPGKVPDSIRAYDLVSMHYPGTNGNMNQYGIETKGFGYPKMPVLFDEWAHVACYNNFTVQEDPNIREFWGQSLDSMWQKVFEAEGGLGGAIWGMIDETFMLPDTLPGFNEWWGRIDDKIIPAAYAGHTVGYGEWGIIDTWRRKKPEFWNTKKAYSPVKLLKTDFTDFDGETILEIPVYNRFDHTNFSELEIKYAYSDRTGILSSPDIKPHEEGTLNLPLQKGSEAQDVLIEFYDGKNNMIDSYTLRLKAKNTPQKTEGGESLALEETSSTLIVRTEKDLTFWLDKETGMFTQARKDQDTLRFSGPYLNLRTRGRPVIYSYYEIDEQMTEWNLINLSQHVTENQVLIYLEGTYAESKPVSFTIEINARGAIRSAFRVDQISDAYIREAGIKYLLGDEFDSLSWNRDSYWSSYPKEHLSNPNGTTALYSEYLNRYQKKPLKDWIYDTKSFYYDGTKDESSHKLLTHIARSTKENIYEYRLSREDGIGLTVLGDGDLGCRIEKDDETITLFVNNRWDYVDLSWGNYQRNIKIDSIKGESRILFF